MNTSNKHFPAKTLLFGEHIVLENGEGFAIPNQRFSCYWQNFYDANQIPSRDISKQVLKDFFSFLKNASINHLFDLKKYQYMLEENIQWLNSNIPIGYGLGSSGAFCAAIYHHYALAKTDDLNHLKTIFAAMESFFHGKSSGLDPLVSYLNDGIWLKSMGQIEQVSPISKEDGSLTLFLLDTIQPRQASDIIARFQSLAQDETFQLSCIHPLKEANAAAIQAFLSYQAQEVYDRWGEISQLQRTFFDFAIPQHCLDAWDNGLQDSVYRLKLCGAGGGGFLLGVTKDWEKSVLLLKDFPLIPFWKV